MTPEELRCIYGKPLPVAEAKAIKKLDKHCCEFIGNSPLLILATSDGNEVDISPKGGTPGFVQVETEKSILLPDYAGNNRLDGLLNILSNPNVSILFLIPGVLETLRVIGKATIKNDNATKQRFDHCGKVVKTVTRVEVTEAFIHCGAPLSNSRLWKPEAWPTLRPISSVNKILRDHLLISSERDNEIEFM